jgi:hypothetical protein
MSMAKPVQVLTKIVVIGAIALGSWVGAAAPANADANPIGTDPNPFSALGCSCPETAPAGSPAGEINRGIRAGLSASSPGLSTPAQPSQPRP